MQPTLLATYRPPVAAVGDVLRCRRHGTVVVSGFSSRLNWPLCTINGQPSVILFGDLLRAVRRESGVSLVYWFDVSESTVRKWRKLLNAQATTAGALAGRRAAAKHPERRAKLSASARTWSAADVGLLGTLPDQDIADRIGKSRAAVRSKRRELAIASAKFGGRCKVCGRRFSVESNASRATVCSAKCKNAKQRRHLRNTAMRRRIRAAAVALTQRLER